MNTVSCEAHLIQARDACIEADFHGDDVYINANNILMCQYCDLTAGSCCGNPFVKVLPFGHYECRNCSWLDLAIDI